MDQSCPLDPPSEAPPSILVVPIRLLFFKDTALLKSAFFNQFQGLIKSKPLEIFEKATQLYLGLFFLFSLVIIYIKHKGREKAAKVVGFVFEFMSVDGTYTF